MPALAFATLAGACSPASPTPTRRSGITTRTDKRALFGDPGLVPTREGERVRREVALAGEITGAARTFPYIEAIRADVELDAEGRTQRVLIAARLNTPDLNHDRARDELAEVASGVVGPLEDDALVVVVSSPPDPIAPLPPMFPVLLATGLLGLGVSTGIALERVRRRSRSP